MPQIDVFTWSFPCTDLSKAGKQKGLTNTRSGLVYEVLRILQECKVSGNLPKVLIMENVVDLVQSKFIREFQEIQVELEQLGYTNYTQTLNAKDYGVAQNRDRVFMVSILGNYYYEFPQKIKLEKRLKDYLESEVDEKYYLSDAMLKCFTDMTNRNGLVRGDRFNPHNEETSKYAFAITTMAGNRATDNFIEIPEDTKQGYAKAYDGDGVYINRPHQKRGVVQNQMIQTLKTSGCDVDVVVSDLKREYCNNLIENNLVEEGDMIRHSYTNSRLKDMERKENENGISATLTTRPDTLGIVVYDDYNSSIRADQDTIGTLTTNCGSEAPRNGYKLIEIRESIPGEIRTDEGIRLFENDIIGTLRTKDSGGDKVVINQNKHFGIDGNPNLKPKVIEEIDEDDYEQDAFEDNLKYSFEMNEEEKNELDKKTLSIRKLTPLECWRLMGITDDYFNKASQVCSNAQLYKQAGNGIVVDVFAAIVKNLKGEIK